MKALIKFLLVILFGVWQGAPAYGDETLSTDQDPAAIKIHGFASQGYLISSRNNYIGDSSRGTFKMTEVGLNFTKELTDKLSAGLQLFSGAVGTSGDFDAKFDWFYLDYRWQNWLGFRAGRIKIPFGLYNEVNDADAARAPILLPQSVYPVANRNYLLAQNGVEVYGYHDMGDAGALDYRAYSGTIHVDTPSPTNPALIVRSFEVPYLVGGRLFWETPLDGFKVGVSGQRLRIDADVLLGGLTTVDVKIPAALWVGSTQYVVDDWLFAAEYSRWYVGIESDLIARFPNTKTISERYYAMVNYRLNDLLRPSLYYSFLRPDMNVKGGQAIRQHDVALTMGFDLNQYWLLKLEAHYMNGTGVLSSARNGNIPLRDLKKDWGVFIAKTTAYF